MRASASMHRAARANATQAFSDVVHAAPSENELRFLLAVSLHETTFGSGWSGDGVGSNNMGAIQIGTGWTGDSFTYQDTHPTATGATVYKAAFRAYPTAVEGWQDLVHELYQRRPTVWQAAKSGSVQAVATAMHETGYYEGQGATEADRINSYVKALSGALKEIDANTVPAMLVQVQSPNGTVLGTASVTDADAPGASALFEAYGTPILVAYPNGWRFLRYTSDIMIPARNFLPYQSPEAAPPSFRLVDWIAVASVLGLVGAIFYGTLNVKPGSRQTARAYG